LPAELADSRRKHHRGSAPLAAKLVSDVCLIATKSRSRHRTIDDRCKFMRRDLSNRAVIGERFDLSPRDVIEYCGFTRWQLSRLCASKQETQAAWIEVSSRIGKYGR
jgi:hypothetical protein